ncbi:DUF2848 domain-containing protein [Delftia sp. UME58]|uniref:DUF2848 domain-containing protein n=1 Tax=Delftia sp. UME58 TaxID=1862322 RepID=UPI0016027147|nr:DUF2848 domain-containing protein [Delftia sp. UME58]MBB1653265.1 hypothetical protein [Delftia sp. UME58]
MTLEFDFIQKTGTKRRTVAVHSAIVGGWTGRDKEALAHHVEELQKLGVAPPARTPLFYRVGVSRLTQAQAIEVIGTGSSGEVEYVMLNVEGRLWIGVASDHTDRHVEHMGITVAKQLCDKPVAGVLWPLDEVESHWDKLILRSHIVESGETKLYQEGTVSSLLSPRELLVRFAEEGQIFGDGMLMFGGTCATIGGVRYSPQFSFQIIDPLLDRIITHCYTVHPLPIEG